VNFVPEYVWYVGACERCRRMLTIVFCRLSFYTAGLYIVELASILETLIRRRISHHRNVHDVIVILPVDALKEL